MQFHLDESTIRREPSFFRSRCHEDRDALIKCEINSCSNPIFHPNRSRVLEGADFRSTRTRKLFLPISIDAFFRVSIPETQKRKKKKESIPCYFDNKRTLIPRHRGGDFTNRGRGRECGSAGKKERKEEEEVERNSEFFDFRDERIDFSLASIPVFTHPLFAPFESFDALFAKFGEARLDPSFHGLLDSRLVQRVSALPSDSPKE